MQAQTDDTTDNRKKHDRRQALIHPCMYLHTEEKIEIWVVQWSPEASMLVNFMSD